MIFLFPQVGYISSLEGMPVWHSSHFGTNFGKEWCASCHPLLCRSNSLWWLIAGILLLLGYVTWPVKKKDMVLIPKSALSGDIWLPVFLGENKSRNWVIFFARLLWKSTVSCRFCFPFCCINGRVPQAISKVLVSFVKDSILQS